MSHWLDAWGETATPPVHEPEVPTSASEPPAEAADTPSAVSARRVMPEDILLPQRGDMIAMILGFLLTALVFNYINSLQSRIHTLEMILRR
jgi:hypothetical protein